ncbi:MAG: site-specific DNA-methyltransferase [Chloroflexota bacterium]
MPELTWIGKHAVVAHASQVPFHLLKVDDSLSAGDADSGNLLVEGDNLLALKALLPYYAGKVKLAYADPPYNTGNEKWVYNDNVNSPEIREWLGRVVGAEAEDLSRHDKWLCMMYPRMVLLRELLCEDGAVFISIDDNEFAHLRRLMDDIFGPRNFVGTIVWQKIYTVKNSAKYLSEMHDYVLVYAKQKDRWHRNLRPRDEDTDEDYDNPDDDPRGPWISHALQSRNYYSKGTYQIVSPGGRVIEGPPPGTYWRVSEVNFHKLDRVQKKVWWGLDGNNYPRVKEYLEDAKEGVVPSTWWSYRYAGTNSGAKVELRHITGNGLVFTTPKPVQLLCRILELASDKDSLVLDAFAGSGTTGHAVLKQNAADGGTRRFVMAEIDGDICRSITSERLRRVMAGYSYVDGKGKGKHVDGLGSGFRYCVLGQPVLDPNLQINPGITFSDLARHVFFIETGQPLPSDRHDHSPLVGVANGRAVYLLYNGVLRDKKPAGGNVLTAAVMAALPPHQGPKVVYGTACRLGQERLRREGIVFRQIPYEVRTK